jgi:type VI secretion system protein ImpC
MANPKQGSAPEGVAAKEQVLEKSGSLLDKIVDEGRLAKDEGAKGRGKDLVKEFVAQVLEGSMTVTRDAETCFRSS